MVIIKGKSRTPAPVSFIILFYLLLVRMESHRDTVNVSFILQNCKIVKVTKEKKTLTETQKLLLNVM